METLEINSKNSVEFAYKFSSFPCVRSMNLSEEEKLNQQIEETN